MVKNNLVLYDHKIDQKEYKWEGAKKLKKIPISEMPLYLRENYKKYEDWIES